MNNRLRIRLTKRKKTTSRVYRQGEIYEAKIRQDGYAVVNFGVVFHPDEFELYISDDEFDKLLAR
jgi:hypothetical protein